MKKTRKVAFIGCGNRGKAHARGVKADERCQVVALADINPAAMTALESESGFNVPYYTDYKKMLAEQKPEVVVACLWTGLHLQVLRDCVQAGVKAFIGEKPIAPTWGECLETAKLAETSGCQVTFGHQRRFAKGNLLARELIKSGRFGKIIRMDLYSPVHQLDCGTHTLDQALSFNNESPAKWVLGAVDASKPHAYFNIPSETAATGLVVFANDVRAYYQIGGPDMDMGTGVRVIGTDGFIEVEWDGQFKRAVVYAEPTWTAPQIILPHDHFWLTMPPLIKNALDCLETGAEPELSYKKAMRAAEIIFALYESMRRHARVELPLTGITDNPFISMLEAGEFAAARKLG